MMRKWIGVLLICAAVLTGGAYAEEDVLRIAVMYEKDAQNWSSEEAFFSEYPDTRIEYTLYSQEQLNDRLLAGTLDTDLVILPYRELVRLEERENLLYLDEAAGLKDYPEQIIDLRHLLMKNNKLFALPVSITQNYWCWNESVGEKLGMSWPGSEPWTWEECVKLAEGFPKDTDGDQIPDIYFMPGTRYEAFPAFQNVNIDMFSEYLKTHSDFNLFSERYMTIFRSFLAHDGLQDLEHQIAGQGCVLIGYCNADNPMVFMDQIMVNEAGFLLFLPPPVLEKEKPTYPGNLTGCAVLRNAQSPEKAGAFIRAMISNEALATSIYAREDELISSYVPVKSFGYMENEKYLPAFGMEENPSFCVCKGRDFVVIDFQDSEDAFKQAQKFRSQLVVNNRMLDKDFYQGAYSALQEWWLKHIDDSKFTEEMNQLFESTERKR